MFNAASLKNRYERYCMKKLMTLLLTGALATASVNQVNAGDREWATVGKVLTGAAVLALTADALAQHSHYHRQPVVVTHVPSPVVVRPPAYVPFTPPHVVVNQRARPRFHRQRRVTVRQAPVVVVETRSSRHRHHGHRSRRPVVVAPAPVFCPSGY